MKDIDIRWQTATFDELNLRELYEILRLRADVFVVEQECPYQDVDGMDEHCLHVLGWNADGRLVAYARILPVGVDAYELIGEGDSRHGAIGRVVVAKDSRGIGHQLMDKSIEAYAEFVGADIPCIIHAQAHLKRFYESHGFSQTSGICVIDGIDHIEMTRLPESAL